MKLIYKELKSHVPFTIFGSLTGVAVMLLMIHAQVPRQTSENLFEVLHPVHVLLSALVTTGMFRLHGSGKILPTIIIGYVGAVGIATLSDCIIPYLGEWMLAMPNRGLHIGLFDEWWLVSLMAVAGIVIAYFWPRTKLPHAGHVLLSIWASLFHMTSALGTDFDLTTILLTPVFLFLAVWIPCCTSDIIFPLLFPKKDT